jgi:hypothetical protein
MKTKFIIMLLFLIMFSNCLVTTSDSGDNGDSGDSGDDGDISDGDNWIMSTSGAWEKRAGHISLVFDNTNDDIDNPKMWVMGGAKDSSTLLNDVWYSEDGENWIQATDNAGWAERWCFSGVVFDDTDDRIHNPKMWIMGGQSSGLGYLNDVWYSEDGENWIQATDNAEWSIRYSHSCVVFDNKIWLIGGYNGNTYYQYDVWYSEDGVNWIEQDIVNGFGARYSHSCVVFDNTNDDIDNPKIWILGGFDESLLCRNDVWYSEDGVNWIQATDNADWSIRSYHSNIVYDSKMWVMGGGDLNWGNTGILYYNDVWYSEDGENWIQATDNADWPSRLYHSLIVFNNRMWIIAGATDIGVNDSLNDVWYSE